MIDKEFLEHNKNVEGWLTLKEGKLLYSLAKKCKGRENTIVEIGSWCGKSLLFLTLGSREGNKLKVYACDKFEGDEKCGYMDTYNKFLDNIKYDNLNELIIPKVMFSEDLSKDFDKPVSLIFIDGDHSYSAVKIDYENWFSKLVPGGVIAFHDTTTSNLGPEILMRKEIFFSKNLRNIKCVDSIVCAEKCNNQTINDKIKNRLVYCRWETLQVLRRVRNFIRRFI